MGSVCRDTDLQFSPTLSEGIETTRAAKHPAKRKIMAPNEVFVWVRLGFRGALNVIEKIAGSKHHANNVTCHCFMFHIVMTTCQVHPQHTSRLPFIPLYPKSPHRMATHTLMTVLHECLVKCGKEHRNEIGLC